MNFTAGKMQTGFDLPEVTNLMAYLADNERLHVQLYDSNGGIVSGYGGCACSGANIACERLCKQMVKQLLSSNEPCQAICPHGGKINALPIAHGTTLFGALLLCTLPESKPQEAVTTTGIDPLANTITCLLAQSNYYEHEVESLTTDLALRYEELALLYEVGENIPLRASIPAVMRYVVEKLEDVVDCDCVCWVPEDGTRPETFWPKPRRNEWNSRVLLISNEMARRVREKCQMVNVYEPHADEVMRTISDGMAAIVGFPVATDDEYYGTLVMFRSEGEFYSGQAMLVNAVARRSGTVIRNANLYNQLDSLFLSTIKTLVRLIEGKDAYTRGHSERVSIFAGQLAELINLPMDEKEALSRSSLLHDIGKIKVPENILQKQGSLTDEEFAVIQCHPGFGADMLSPISQLTHCLPDIRHHHERIDGRGYPDHLAGDAIPLRARIIAVADTFDALTSDRCYRPRFGLEKAVIIVEEATGTQLWPEAANALVSNKSFFKDYLESLKNANPVS